MDENKKRLPGLFACGAYFLYGLLGAKAAYWIFIGALLVPTGWDFGDRVVLAVATVVAIHLAAWKLYGRLLRYIYYGPDEERA